MSIFTIKAVTAKPQQNIRAASLDKWRTEREYTTCNAEDGSSIVNYFEFGSPKLEMPSQDRTFGMYTNDGVANSSEMKEELRNTQSHIWTGVINFEEKQGIKLCSSPTQADIGFKNAFKEFCKEANLDEKNLKYLVALHENSDLYHMHYLFYEKQPKRISKVSNELQYSKKFLIDKKAVEKMPKIVDKHFNNLIEKNELLDIRIKERRLEVAGKMNIKKPLDKLSKTMKNDESFNRNIEYADWYKESNEATKKQVDKITAKLIKSNFKKYQEQLKVLDREKKKEFRSSLYDDIGKKIIRNALNYQSIEEDTVNSLDLIKKSNAVYKLSKKDQIQYRRIKKVEKIKKNDIVKDVEKIDINLSMTQVMQNTITETNVKRNVRKL